MNACAHNLTRIVPSQSPYHAHVCVRCGELLIDDCDDTSCYPNFPEEEG